MARKRRKQQKIQNQVTRAGTRTRLTFLPLELVAQILSLLDFRDILNVQITSKYFNRIVGTTRALQYIIDLAVARCVDGPPHNKLSKGERYSALKDRQDAWKELKFNFKKRINPPTNLKRWAFRGGVLVLAHLDKPELAKDDDYEYFNNVDVIHVRSNDQNSAHRCHRFDTVFSDLVVDPTQDLLILLKCHEASDDDGLPIFFFSLSDGGPHSRAIFHSLTVPVLDDVGEDSLQVRDDIIAVTGVSAEVLTIVNWVTGSSRSMNTNGSIGCLLTSRGFVVARCRDLPEGERPSLDVYFIKENRLGHMSLNIAGRFQLPNLQDGANCTIDCRAFGSCDYSKIPVSQGSPALPFSVSPGPFTFSLEILVEESDSNIISKFIVLVSARDFVSAIDRWRSRYHKSRRNKICTMAWEDWGPTSTWWFDERTWDCEESLWEHSAYGYRVMLTGAILDLNLRDIQRVLGQRPTHQLDEDAQVPYQDRDIYYSGDPDKLHVESGRRVIEFGTRIEAGTCFKATIETRAPFRKTYLEETWLMEHNWYMVDEEVLAVDCSDSTGHPEEFHVYAVGHAW